MENSGNNLVDLEEDEDFCISNYTNANQQTDEE